MQSSTPVSTSMMTGTANQPSAQRNFIRSDTCCAKAHGRASFRWRLSDRQTSNFSSPASGARGSHPVPAGLRRARRARNGRRAARRRDDLVIGRGWARTASSRSPTARRCGGRAFRMRSDGRDGLFAPASWRLALCRQLAPASASRSSAAASCPLLLELCEVEILALDRVRFRAPPLRHEPEHRHRVRDRCLRLDLPIAIAFVPTLDSGAKTCSESRLALRLDPVLLRGRARGAACETNPRSTRVSPRRRPVEACSPSARSDSSSLKRPCSTSSRPKEPPK